MRVRRLATGAAAAAACLCLAALGPAPAGAKTHKSKLIRKPPLGVHFPRNIGEMRMIVLNEVGDPDIALYSPASPPTGPNRMLSVAVGKREIAPTVERMREQSRLHAASKGESKILFEGSFAWPGHDLARTFHGSYTAGSIRRQYWQAWEGGYGVIVIAETPLDEPERMERLAAAIVATIFGGGPAAP
jgi:hypothetical protein